MFNHLGISLLDIVFLRCSSLHHHHRHRHRLLTTGDLYLQFLHPLVVVSYGGLQRLQELLLCLELLGHGARPDVAGRRVVRLAEVGDGRALGAGGLDPEHAVLWVSLHSLLELHLVDLQRGYGVNMRIWALHLANISI